MIHLVLDTNIFTADVRLRRSEFWVIENLAKAGVLTLHVPYVVEQEFLSQREQAVKEPIDAAVRSLGQLSRTALPDELNLWLKSTLLSLQDKRQEIIDSSGHAFRKWLDVTKAQRIDMCKAQSLAALDAYFKGNPPFRQPKTRNDIPDSFVFQAIQKISAETNGGDIYFVCADKKLRNSASNLPNVIVFDSLEMFVGSEDVQSAIESNDPLGNLSFASSRIATAPQHSKILNQVIESLIGEEVVWKTIEYSGWSNNSDEATITSYGEPESTSLTWTELEYYGDGRFTIPFRVSLPVTISFYIYKADYWVFEEDEGYLPSISDHNDHVYEAEAEIKITIEGRFAFDIIRCEDKKNEFEVDHESGEIDSVLSIETTEHITS